VESPEELPALAEDVRLHLAQTLHWLAEGFASHRFELDAAEVQDFRVLLQWLADEGEDPRVVDAQLGSELLAHPMPGGAAPGKHLRFLDGRHLPLFATEGSDAMYVTEALFAVAYPLRDSADVGTLELLATAYRDCVLLYYAVHQLFRSVPRRRDAAFILLAGGQSTRMGAPKARLAFDGQLLLPLLVSRMRRLVRERVVVAGPVQCLPGTPAPVLRDDDPGQGPLAGLVVGLREIRQPLAFVASCDLPFLNPALAAYLLDQAEGYDMVVPEWEGRLHPLHAVYRTSLQPMLAERLRAGQRRLMDLLECVRVRRVSEAEVRDIDPDGLSLMNLNTPEDYQRALEIWPEWRKRTRNPT
jgi:molybdopterin-guanine dinucleotide biosynthesis protein A